MRPEIVNRLIVVSGPPCSGKTGIARELALQLPAVHLELDRIREAILPGSKNSEADRDIAYRAMHLAAEYLLQTGDVILDATYARQERRTDMNEFAERTRARLVVIQCKVPPDAACLRFRERAKPHFAVDLDEGRVRRLAEEFRYDESALVIDATQSTENSLQIILRHLGQNPRHA